MKILGIETSCDETAVCILEAEGDLESPRFSVLGNALYSQVKTHAEYGGVFPNLAKREHARNLVPLLDKALRDSTSSSPLSPTSVGSSLEWTTTPLEGPRPVKSEVSPLAPELDEKLHEILKREPGLYEMTKEFLNSTKKPDIDLIAVTAGPGLEPALWVGINFALALGEAWNIPVMPTNHMEGHILSPLFHSHANVEFPALALLISGGHTELVLVEAWNKYKVIGQTKDDAVGEAFDKTARMLNLPYPGGPEISKLAAAARANGISPRWKLPRPMLKSDDLDFSFSGIKTSVLYLVKKLYENPEFVENDQLKPEVKSEIALEFENAVTEVLVGKTKKALEQYGIKSLILGGGVIANTFIRESFKKLNEQYPDVTLLIPEIELSTDNAVMIAIAGYIDHLTGKKPSTIIVAQGNLSL